MIKFDSPLSAFEHWGKTTLNKEYLRQYINGGLKIYTFKESGDEARRIATAINGFDLPAKSKVALLSSNCAHWVMAELKKKTPGKT